MKTKRRSLTESVSGYFDTQNVTWPTSPYYAYWGYKGRLVAAPPGTHMAGDRVRSGSEEISESDKHPNGFRACIAYRYYSDRAYPAKSATIHTLPCVPHVTSLTAAQAIGTGNFIPVWSREVSFGWVPTEAPETAPTADIWETLRQRRLTLESDLYAGLSTPEDASAMLRALIELKDIPQSLGAYTDLCNFAVKATRRGTLSKSATVTQVAQQYLTELWGRQQTTADAVKWCANTLVKRPVKLLIHQPVEHGRTLRRAFTIDPYSGVVSTYDRQFTTSPIELTWSYDHADVQNGKVDDYCLANTVSDWQNSGLRMRPYKRRLLTGVFFGRVAKPELYTQLELLGEREIVMSLDYSAARFNPLRDFVLASHPITTSWQVTPFSFLVDWVVNVAEQCRRLETALSVATARLSFDEGLWTSIREDVVTSVPKLKVDATVINRLQSYTSSSFTVQRQSTINYSVEWAHVATQRTYQRGPTVPILGEQSTVLRGFKFDLKLTPYRLTAGAALLIAQLANLRLLKKLLG